VLPIADFGINRKSEIRNRNLPKLTAREWASRASRPRSIPGIPSGSRSPAHGFERRGALFARVSTEKYPGRLPADSNTAANRRRWEADGSPANGPLAWAGFPFK
jgi:hypothetical protein